MCLGQERTGRGGGRLFVEEIEVAAARGEPVVFPCRCWVTEDDPNAKSGRILTPGETVTPEYDSKLETLCFKQDLIIYLVW